MYIKRENSNLLHQALRKGAVSSTNYYATWLPQKYKMGIHWGGDIIKILNLK